MCDSLGEGRGSTVGWRATVLWITLKLRCICTTESEKVTLWYFRNTREKADCSERIQGKSPSIRHSRSHWIPLSRLIPLSELIPLPLSTLTGVPLSSLIPDKNKLITINLIRMIFILLWFCACRKDLLPGAYRRHSWQAALLRFLSGYVGWPRSAHDAAKRYSLPSGLVQTSFLTRVRHEQLFAIGKVPLRCARNYHLTNQLPLIDHLISWLTSTIHSWTNVHPCKVSVSQWLRLHCSLMAPVHPASIQYQHLLSW